jgi:hypothetical protein
MKQAASRLSYTLTIQYYSTNYCHEPIQRTKDMSKSGKGLNVTKVFPILRWHPKLIHLRDSKNGCCYICNWRERLSSWHAIEVGRGHDTRYQRTAGVWHVLSARSTLRWNRAQSYHLLLRTYNWDFLLRLDLFVVSGLVVAWSERRIWLRVCSPRNPVLFLIFSSEDLASLWFMTV